MAYSTVDFASACTKRDGVAKESDAVLEFNEEILILELVNRDILEVASRFGPLRYELNRIIGQRGVSRSLRWSVVIHIATVSAAGIEGEGEGIVVVHVAIASTTTITAASAAGVVADRSDIVAHRVVASAVVDVTDRSTAVVVDRRDGDSAHLPRHSLLIGDGMVGCNLTCRLADVHFLGVGELEETLGSRSITGACEGDEFPTQSGTESDENSLIVMRVGRGRVREVSARILIDHRSNFLDRTQASEIMESFLSSIQDCCDLLFRVELDVVDI